MDLTCPLVRLVIDLIADDYEEIGMIMEEVRKRAVEFRVRPTVAEVKDILVQLVACGLATAVRLDPSRPAQKLTVDDLAIFEADYYFLLTSQGRLLLEQG